MEKSRMSFNLRQYSTPSFLMIFHMASMLSFRFYWQMTSCSILDTSNIKLFSISLEISQLKVTCFSTDAERVFNSGILLKASCISSKLSSLTVLFRLEVTSLMKVLMLPANSAKPLYTFFLKKSSSISERTNSLFSFSLSDSAALLLFSSSVARKAFCLFLISTLLLQIPNSSCSMASQVQGVIKGVTTSSFRSVMIRMARSSLGQSLGFFISSSSIFFATLFAISAQVSDSLMNLICGSTRMDMTTDMSPSEILLTVFRSISLQLSLRLISPMVDGILREKMLRPTAQQSRQTSCRVLMRSFASTSANSEMKASLNSFVKNR